MNEGTWTDTADASLSMAPVFPEQLAAQSVEGAAMPETHVIRNGGQKQVSGEDRREPSFICQVVLDGPAGPGDSSSLGGEGSGERRTGSSVSIAGLHT